MDKIFVMAIVGFIFGLLAISYYIFMALFWLIFYRNSESFKSFMRDI